MVAKASVFVRSPSVLSQNYRRVEVIFTDLAVIATNRPTASPLKVGFSSAVESPNTGPQILRGNALNLYRGLEISTYD
jgi:hypothetical protein